MSAKNMSQAGDLDGAALQRQPGPPRRILVVDDEPLLRRLNTEVLVDAGYRVDTAEDGAVAWDALQIGSYDLLITDNEMPNVSGIGLLKKLRAARMDMPVIMATGTFPKDEFTQYPWLQPAATLLKPYTIEELLGTVKTVLREADSSVAGSLLFMDRDLKENKISQVAESAGAPRQCPTNFPHRILVVDDDSDTRQLSVDVLAGSGYDVEAAKDGAAGWEALQDNDYDLVVTDNKMPRMTGIEMLEQLRSARMSLPVIMATRSLPVHEFAHKPWLTPDAMLQRPFSNDDLLATVKKVLHADDGNDDRKETLLPKHF
jgi:DNA-binding response OmpR family regulator